jgi:hypothetical protein
VVHIRIKGYRTKSGNGLKQVFSGYNHVGFQAKSEQPWSCRCAIEEGIALGMQQIKKAEEVNEAECNRLNCRVP